MCSPLPPTDPSLLKSTLRTELKKKLRTFPRKDEESNWICNALLQHPRFQDAETILAFVPLKSEPDISPILSDKRILLPYVVGEEMFFASSKALEKSPLGFLEPKDKTEVPYQKALMIVPMLGFDDTLLRLGRGGGFYDRYIAKHQDQLYTLGVAFSISKVEQIPQEWNDLRLDEILHL